MLKNTFTAIILLAALAVVPMFAEGHGNIRCTVPFEFIVGNTTLPSGEYEIVEVTQELFHVRALDGRTSAFALTQPASATYWGQEARLTFEMIDGKYHLVKAARPGFEKELDRPSGSRSGVLAHVKAVLR